MVPWPSKAVLQPAAVFHPARGLTLTGPPKLPPHQPLAELRVRLPFDFLEWPAPGSYPLAERTVMGPEHSGEPPRVVHRDGTLIMVDDDRIQMIDFDDGGFGYRLFEIATALVKYRDQPDYPTLKHALTEGYLSHRLIDLAPLDLVMAIRAATYIGWNSLRQGENGAEARHERLVSDARDLARVYLGN